MSASPPLPDPPDNVDSLEVSWEDNKVNEVDTRQEIVDLTNESDSDQVAVSVARTRSVTPKKESREPSQVLSEPENYGESSSRKDPQVVHMEASGNMDAAMQNDPTIGQSKMRVKTQQPELHDSVEIPDDFLYSHTDEQLLQMLETGQLDFSAQPEESTRNVEEQHMPRQTPASIDEAAENRTAAAEFETLQKAYDRNKKRGETTIRDDISFKAAQAEEVRRLKRVAKAARKPDEKVREAQSEVRGDEEDLFFPDIPPELREAGDDQSPNLDSAQMPKKSAAANRTQKPRNRLNAAELRESMAGGLQLGQAKEKKSGRNTRKPKEKSSKKSEAKTSAAKKKGSEDKVSKKRGRPRKGPTYTNLASLSRSDVVKDAQANKVKGPLPTFSSKRKDEALKELVASIPAAERDLAISDKEHILKATKKFSGRGAVRSDGKGGWLLKGMRSSLFNHQVLGGGFLRDRENGGTKPHGGMVCDAMGYGKTISMLANVLDGKPDPQSPVRTTLIVATPSLLGQWMDEIDQHFEPGVMGRVLRYHSGARLHSNDPVSDLKSYDIILTTYAEVRQSYPVYKPPMHLVSEEAKNKWWKEFYREKVGYLHQIKFFRVVLDEAQAIKNYQSLTSIACRQLIAHYRWIISGTPVQNYVDELYSYFSFLRVPHTGDFSTFSHNYLDSRTSYSTVNTEKLSKMLQAIMLRRTHVDQILNAPIVVLPGIEHETILLEFNEVERAIYKLIKSKFINVINSYSKSGTLNTQYRNVLSMMTKLRMMTGHILLVQDTLKKEMVAADVEALWRLTAKEVETTDTPNTNTLIQLRTMLNNKSRQRKKQATGPVEITDASLEPEVHPEEVGGSYGLSFKFRKFLRSLKESKVWPELHARSICHKCREQPDDPWVTSCYHVYCKECLTAMAAESGGRGEPRVSCLECGIVYDEATECTGLRELGFNSPTTVTKAKENRERKNSKTAKGKKGRRNVPDSDDESEEEDVDWIELNGALLPSAKTTATKACILNWLREDPETKIIIYSQFLDQVRILSKICAIEDWGFVTFTGKMSFEARERAVKVFRNDPMTKIMLCTLKAGGVGLNLTMASRVLILDLVCCLSPLKNISSNASAVVQQLSGAAGLLPGLQNRSGEASRGCTTGSEGQHRPGLDRNARAQGRRDRSCHGPRVSAQAEHDHRTPVSVRRGP